jgi:DASH complex subunit SPC19
MIKRYKIDLADEVEPAINELVERAEQGLAALEKKESLLKAKVISPRVAIVITRLLTLDTPRLKLHKLDPTDHLLVQQLHRRWSPGVYNY